jgi:tight adherence protein B
MRAGVAARPGMRLRARRRLAAEAASGPLEALAAWCDDVARGLRLGASLHAALATDPAPPGLATVVRAAAQGEAVAEAALRADAGSRREHDDATRFVLRTLAIASLGGAGAPHALERTASALRDRSAAAAERRAQAAHAMLSMQVLTWLPVVVLTWLFATSGAARDFVVRSPRGWACLVVGAACNALGRRVMRRLVARVA